jgi:hypothetical protein
VDWQRPIALATPGVQEPLQTHLIQPAKPSGPLGVVRHEIQDQGSTRRSANRPSAAPNVPSSSRIRQRIPNTEEP